MDEPTSPFAEPSPPAGLPPGGRGEPSPERVQPRLGIGHLLLWTLGSAIALAVNRVLWDTADMPDWYRSFWDVVQALYGMLAGAALASLMLFAHRRCTRGPAFPTQPGHWLLLVLGLELLVGWGTFGPLRFYERLASPIYSGQLVPLCEGLVYGSEAIGFVLACVLVRNAVSWQVFFGAAILSHAIHPGWALFILVSELLGESPPWQSVDGLYVVASIGAWLLLLAAVGGDLARRRWRDWLHWTGVAVALLETLLAWSSRLWFWLFSG